MMVTAWLSLPCVPVVCFSTVNVLNQDNDETKRVAVGVVVETTAAVSIPRFALLLNDDALFVRQFLR